MRRIVLSLILLSAAFVSVARGELVMPLWEENPAQEGGDAGRFAALFDRLEESARLYAEKNPSARAVAVAAEEECTALLDAHGWEREPDAAETLQRMRFWFRMTAGMYLAAAADASDLFSRTGRGIYAGWEAMALYKAGSPRAFGEERAASAPEGALAAARFALAAGDSAYAAKAALGVWMCEPGGSDRRVRAAETAVEALAREGRGFEWRKIVRLTLEETAGEKKEEVLERLLARAGGKLEGEDSLWRRFVAGKLAAGPAVAGDDLHERARELVFSCLAGLPGAPSVGEAAGRLEEWGETELLSRFASICTAAGRGDGGLVLALMRKKLYGKAAEALQAFLTGTEDEGEKALVCRQTAREAERLGVPLLRVVSGLDAGALEKAYFAFRTGDEAGLERAVEALRKEGRNGWAFLVVLASAVREGRPVSASLDALDRVMGKGKFGREWLSAFRYAAVVRAALASTRGEKAELLPLLDECVGRMAGGDPAAAALVFDAMAGDDERFAAESAARLAEAAEKGEGKTLLEEALYARLLMLEGADAEISERAAEAFPRNGGIQLLAAKALLKAGRVKEARARLKEAFIYGEGHIRAEAEKMLSKLDAPGKEPSTEGGKR